jgi:hypothetical protein
MFPGDHIGVALTLQQENDQIIAKSRRCSRQTRKNAPQAHCPLDRESLVILDSGHLHPSRTADRAAAERTWQGKGASIGSSFCFAKVTPSASRPKSGQQV